MTAEEVPVAYVDHVVIAVPDLATAAARWARATGVTFSPAGRHPAGTHNALGVLPGQELYVELLAAHDHSSSNEWVRLARTREGPLTWAVGTRDLARDLDRLAAQGLPVGEVTDGSRTCPDGRVVTWQAAMIGTPGSSPWPFVISWPTSGPERLGMDPAVAGVTVTGLTVRVPDPAHAVEVLTQALGFAAVTGEKFVVTDGAVQLRVASSGPATPGVVAIEVAGTAGAPVVVDGVKVVRSAARVVV